MVGKEILDAPMPIKDIVDGLASHAYMLLCYQVYGADDGSVILVCGNCDEDIWSSQSKTGVHGGLFSLVELQNIASAHEASIHGESNYERARDTGGTETGA